MEKPATINCPKCDSVVVYDMNDEGEDPIICEQCEAAFGTIWEDDQIKAEVWE